MTKEPPIIESYTRREFPHRIVWPLTIVPVLILFALLMWIIPNTLRKRGLVNLSPAYNGRTTESTSVLDNNASLNTLEEFPLGENKFAGVSFSVNGIIQLNGRYPDHLEGVSLNRRCRRLHLLHGTVSKVSDGTTTAKVVLHYADGGQAEIAIKYGEHVRDWWQRPTDPPPQPPVLLAWHGQNRLTRKEGAALNVYLSTFENPRPKDKIRTVDFVSANTHSWPFFLGLTTD
jgi:hypothetical protein